MPTHSKSKNISTTGGTIQSASRTYTGDNDQTFRHTWASAPTSLELDISFILANVQSLVIISTVACTLKVNDASTGFLITLVANIAYDGDTDNVTPITDITDDVTSIFLTSAVAAGSITIQVLTQSD